MNYKQIQQPAVEVIFKLLLHAYISVFKKPYTHNNLTHINCSLHFSQVKEF